MGVMKILIGILWILVFVQAFWIRTYQRQISDICRQLSFLMEHDSNMMVSAQTKRGGIGKLTGILNEFLALRRREKNDYAKKEKIISETYTNLSHDIRTPLTSLDGYFQLLKESSDADEQKKYIRIIQERIVSLKDMLEELFVFTKLKNDSYQLELSDCCINKIVKSTVFSYYDEWTSRGITPEIQIADELLYMQGNEQAIRRILQNIIKNALDHGRDSIGIRLFARNGQIHLQVRNNVEHPEEIDVSQVFERFYKADSSRSRTSTGLGLSIARELAVRMNGSMEARLNGQEFCVEAVFLQKVFANMFPL